MTRVVAVFLTFVALGPLSCGEPLGTDALPAPAFIVSPNTVAPGDTFAVVFTLRNPTGRTVTITSGAGCLFFLRALRGSDQVSVQGLPYFCTAAITSFQLPPHGSLEVVRRALAAERRGTGPGSPLPLPPGQYRIQTMMNAALPDLEALLTVVDSSGAT